eukprot:10174806-Karenia_brevis.AAC.1
MNVGGMVDTSNGGRIVVVARAKSNGVTKIMLRLMVMWTPSRALNLTVLLWNMTSAGRHLGLMMRGCLMPKISFVAVVLAISLLVIAERPRRHLPLGLAAVIRNLVTLTTLVLHRS